MDGDGEPADDGRAKKVQRLGELKAMLEDGNEWERRPRPPERLGGCTRYDIGPPRMVGYVNP